MNLLERFMYKKGGQTLKLCNGQLVKGSKTKKKENKKKLKKKTRWFFYNQYSISKSLSLLHA